MMTRTSFDQLIEAFKHRTPFRPFAIEFDDGERWVVERPEAVMNYGGGGTAVYFRGDGSIDFVDCEAVKQLVELPSKAAV